MTGVLAAALAFSDQAAAQAPPAVLVQGLLADVQPHSARQYATPDGAVRFVLDRSGGRVALVRFEGDPEVHVLRPVAGAGGDEIYRTETGDVMLRLTSHGGLVVYNRAHATGMPAGEERSVAPLAPEAPPPNLYEARLRGLQNETARRLGRPVAFVGPDDPGPAASGVVLDAAARAAEGMVAAPGSPIRRVVFTFGPAAGAVVQGDTLVIVVAPAQGYAGRPSSVTVRTVVARAAQGPER